MNLETFFEKFELFADAPNAVAKMRELVLRLAFSGGFSGRKSAADGLPNRWRTQTVESISSSITPGFACARSHQVENGHVHLRTHNISTLGTLNFDLLVRIAPAMVDSEKASIQRGDILFNNTNSQELVGKTCLVDRDYDYGFSNHITRIRLKEGVDPSFVVFYFTLLRNNGYFARLCNRWINQAGINTNVLKEQMIPLPPLAEQKRIVAKVDELMALCDRLEAQQRERETQQAALARAAVTRFADAPTPANIELLFHKSYSISTVDLRKTILTLAVQGKLVPQDANDEPAGALFAHLERQVQRFAAENEYRTTTPEPIDETMSPFPLPDSWKWVRLSSLFNVVTDGDHLPPPKASQGVAFLTIGNITTGNLDFSGCRFVPEAYFESLASFRRPTAGDILYTVVGATYGRLALIATETPFCVQRHIAILKPVANMAIGFLLTLLKSPLVYEQATASTTGTAQPTIPLRSLRNFLVPLPPLAEQRRIVAKVDKLMALVDQLEAQLAASRAAATTLMEALVAELTTRSLDGAQRNPGNQLTPSFKIRLPLSALSERQRNQDG